MAPGVDEILDIVADTFLERCVEVWDGDPGSADWSDGLRRNNANVVLVVEHWKSSSPPRGLFEGTWD